MFNIKASSYSLKRLQGWICLETIERIQPVGGLVGILQPRRIQAPSSCRRHLAIKAQILFQGHLCGTLVRPASKVTYGAIMRCS